MTQQSRQQQTSAQNEQNVQSPLQTERGNTTIEEVVVTKVAGMAAQEIEGVQMGGGRGIGGLVPGGGGGQGRGVSVQVGQVEAAVDLAMTVEYGKPIPQLTESVRRNVINRVEQLVGLRVTEVNITVNDVILPQPSRQQQLPQESQSGAEEQPRVR